MSERYKSSPTAIGHGALRSNELAAPKKAKQHPVLPPLVFSQSISANIDFGVWPAQDVKKTDGCFFLSFCNTVEDPVSSQTTQTRTPGSQSSIDEKKKN